MIYYNFNTNLVFILFAWKQQRGFTPPPPQNCNVPSMHVQQRQPAQPGSGFQNMPSARSGNPNTPSGKRPQDARNQIPSGPQKK